METTGSAGYGVLMSEIPDSLRQALVSTLGPATDLLKQQLQSRDNMIAELERRGYPARGKSDAEIVELLKLPPPGKA